MQRACLTQGRASGAKEADGDNVGNVQLRALCSPPVSPVGRWLMAGRGERAPGRCFWLRKAVRVGWRWRNLLGLKGLWGKRQTVPVMV